MKKLKITLLLTVTAVCLCLFGCKKTQNVNIEGVKNLIFNSTVESYDFSEGITATVNGKEQDIQIDSSNVKFKTVGEYEVNYSCENYTKTAKVRIYGSPRVSARDTVLTYEEAYNGSSKDILAVDSFGSNVQITVSNYGVGEKYLYKYGNKYQVEYIATDIAGNSVSFKRTVTVSGCEQNFGNANIDLVNPVITKNIIQDKKVISVNGRKDFLILSNGNVNLGDIAKSLGVGNHELTVYTDKGYGKLAVSITDNEEIKYAFDYGDKIQGINGYIYTFGDNIVLPKIINDVGSYQNFSVDYCLKNKENILPTNEFTAINYGEYSYTAKITKNGFEKEIINKFYVVSEVEKINGSFSVNTNQFTTNFTPYYANGSSFDFVGEVKDGNGVGKNAIKFTNKNIRNANEKLFLNAKLVKEILSTGTHTFSFSILLGEEFEGLTDGVAVYLHATGKKGWTQSVNMGTVNPTINEWTKITIDLKNWTNPYGFPSFYDIDILGDVVMNYESVGICIDPYRGTNNKDVEKTIYSVYFSDFTCGKTESTISANTYYDFTNGDTFSISASQISTTINEVTVNYDKFNITEYGIIKLLEKEPKNTSDTEILATDIFAVKKGNELTFNGKTFVGLVYNSGNIYEKGTTVALPKFGKDLTKYGLTVSYKLEDINGNEKQFNTVSFEKIFDEVGGYNFKLVVSGSITKTFNNFVYIYDDTTKIYEQFSVNNFKSNYLKYEGKMEVNGEIKECFSVKIENNPSKHRHLNIDKSVVNQMLDEGKTNIAITLYNYPIGVKDQQIFRLKDDETTKSGASWVPSIDYYSFNAYGSFVTVNFEIDESFRNKDFGISVTRDAIIGNIIFSVS